MIRLWSTLLRTIKRIRFEIEYTLKGNRAVERVIKEIREKKYQRYISVGNDEVFEKTTETLIAIATAMDEAFENLDPDEPSYVLQVGRIYDDALQKGAGITLVFVRDKLRPLLPKTGGQDKNRFNDQDDVELVGEFLYLKHMNPDKTREQITEMLSSAIDNNDAETEERMISFSIEVTARTL